MKYLTSTSNSNSGGPGWRRIATSLVVAVVVALLCCISFVMAQPKVLLRDVKTVTLHRGKMTTGRRSNPVPQLNCVGGNACSSYRPDVVQCTNTGFDGSDVQWKCQADLPENIRFGELNVYCEGYEYPDDPYVLKGSCGLEYKLNYVNNRNSGQSWENPNFKHWADKAKRNSWIGTVYQWTAIGIALFLFYAFVKNFLLHDNRNDPPPPYRPSGSGPYGGGGGGGGGSGGGWGSGWGSGGNKPTNGDGYRPGFWSGLGLGGLAAYLATNRNRQQNAGDSYGAGPSNWSSSRPSASSSQSYSYSQPSSSSYSGGSGSYSASSSTTTRAATGYGGTRRR